jgi:signal transduction histidine kinase
LEIEGEGEIPPEVKITLYRIAQEAFNNISKHANAHQVLLKLSFSENIVVLMVADDGLGFEVDNVSADHLGLGIMHERAQSIGADLEVKSVRGQGTQVILTWHSVN